MIMFSFSASNDYNSSGIALITRHIITKVSCRTRLANSPCQSINTNSTLQ